MNSLCVRQPLKSKESHLDIVVFFSSRTKRHVRSKVTFAFSRVFRCVSLRLPYKQECRTEWPISVTGNVYVPYDPLRNVSLGHGAKINYNIKWRYNI